MVALWGPEETSGYVDMSMCVATAARDRGVISRERMLYQFRAHPCYSIYATGTYFSMYLLGKYPRVSTRVRLASRTVKEELPVPSFFYSFFPVSTLGYVALLISHLSIAFHVSTCLLSRWYGLPCTVRRAVGQVWVLQNAAPLLGHAARHSGGR